MCMGCMGNADLLLTSGILGAAGARIGLKRRWPGRAPSRSDDAALEEPISGTARADDPALHRVPAAR